MSETTPDRDPDHTDPPSAEPTPAPAPEPAPAPAPAAESTAPPWAKSTTTGLAAQPSPRPRSRWADNRWAGKRVPLTVVAATLLVGCLLGCLFGGAVVAVGAALLNDHDRGERTHSYRDSRGDRGGYGDRELRRDGYRELRRDGGPWIERLRPVPPTAPTPAVPGVPAPAVPTPSAS